MKPVYLDNNATSRTAPEVLEAMLPYLGELYGNPSSTHRFGAQVGVRVDEARERVAAGLGAHPDEIVFTAGGSESDNTAVHSAVAAQPDKRHIVTTIVEHPAVLAVARQLESRGYEITRLGVDSLGRLDLDELRQSLRNDTALVSVMYANNETGVLFPLQKIAGMVKDRGIQLHTDAVQAVGKINISLRDLPVDFLSLSGHKFHGPKGVGALFVRRGTPFAGFILGGGQERGRRAGTENTPGIVGLGKAVELAAAGMAEESVRIAGLRDRLQAGLLKAVNHARVNGDPEHRLPNTLSIGFKGVRAEAVLQHLDEIGVCASAGSACHAGSPEPSHVLKAMAVPLDYALGTIRLSLSRYTTEKEIDLVLKELPGIIEHLRSIQPFMDGDGSCS